MTAIAPRTWRILIALLSVGLAAAGLARISGSTVIKDAAQELQMAINISHHGVMSDSEGPPYQPSMYREPLPSVLEAAAVGVSDAWLGTANAAEYFTGTRMKIIKSGNVVVLLALWLTVIGAVRRFTASYALAVAAGLLAAKPFLAPASAVGVDTLNTELLAAALLAPAALCLAAAAESGQAALFALAGVCFGLAALTKSSVLYAFAAVALCVLLPGVCGKAAPGKRLLHAGVMGAAFVLVVAPWMVRNLQLFGEAQISLRGGLALYTRALMDGMTSAEYRGSFYVWAEAPLQPLAGRLLGYGPDDLRLGGRLQRLNYDLDSELYRRDLAAELAGRPQDSITFYRRARAERVRLEEEFSRHRHPHPDVAADRVMKGEGFAILANHPVRAMTTLLPFMWRGGHLTMPALLLGFVFAVWEGRRTLTTFVLPGLILLCFYALVTPFEPRYAIVAQPVAVAVAMILIQSLWRRTYGMTSRTAPD